LPWLLTKNKKISVETPDQKLQLLTEKDDLVLNVSRKLGCADTRGLEVDTAFPGIPEMPLYWKFMPTLRASHATTTFTQQAAGADDWTACADPVIRR